MYVCLCVFYLCWHEAVMYEKWLWSKSCCRKCFMHSHWQLKVEHDFTQAISDMGDEKEPTLQLCMSSEIVKLTIVGMCMMSIRQWCYRKTKEITWQIGNDGLDPMCLQQREDVSMTNHTDATWRNRRWKAHFLCGLIRFLPTISCIDISLSNPIISDTLRWRKMWLEINKL